MGAVAESTVAGLASRLMIWRYRISIGLEALVWALTMAWLVFLVWDTMKTFRTIGALDWRNLAEIALIALLVYWPIIRVRIVHGYWMRDWDDAPRAPQWTASELQRFGSSDNPPIVLDRPQRPPRPR